jgi:hypothetical protein
VFQKLEGIHFDSQRSWDFGEAEGGHF